MRSHRISSFYSRIDSSLYPVVPIAGTHAMGLIGARLGPRPIVLGRLYARWSVSTRRHWETQSQSVVLGARPVQWWVRFRTWARAEGWLPEGILLFDFCSTKDAVSARELIVCVRSVIRAADSEQVTLLVRVARNNTRVAKLYRLLGFEWLGGRRRAQRSLWMVWRPSARVPKILVTTRDEKEYWVEPR